MIKLTDQHRVWLQKAEDHLGEAAALIENVTSDEAFSDPVDDERLRVQDLMDAYDQAYGAMCTLANVRVEQEQARLPKMGARCAD